MTGPAPTLPDRLRVASPGHPRCLVTRSHLLANGFQVLVLHQVLAEVDSGEAGAAGVREEAEEALMRLKVAGGVDQLHIPGREGSLAQGGTRMLPSRPSTSPPLPLKPSLATRQQPPPPPLLFLTAPGWILTTLQVRLRVAPAPRSPKVDQLVIKGPLSMANPKLFPAKV